jgi:hypothetical protein
MKLHELFEASGYIPKNDKEANDPRWQMAITNDIKPGENQRQATRLGFKLDDKGNPPKLRADGKIEEAVMDVANQARMPISAGARGLMHARAGYDKVIDKEQKNYMQSAIDALAEMVKEGNHPSNAFINISQYYKIREEDLAHAFKKHYNMSVAEYYKHNKHSKAHSPKAI